MSDSIFRPKVRQLFSRSFSRRRCSITSRPADTGTTASCRPSRIPTTSTTATSIRCARSITAAVAGRKRRRGWRALRDYADYNEYLTHQKLKLEELLKMKGGFTNEDIKNFRLKFYRRFRHLVRLLPQEAEFSAAGRARARKWRSCVISASRRPWAST